MKKFRVVVTDYDYPDMEIEKHILKASLGVELEELKTKDPEVLKRELRNADAIITQYAPLTADVIEVLENCVAIGRYGIGYDNVDVPACSAKGIKVINVPFYCLEEVSDTAISMIYALTRKLKFYNSALSNGVWDWKPGVPVHRFRKLSVGILGFGNIARCTAEKLHALGLKVMVCDPFVDDSVLSGHGAERVDFKTLLAESDAISVHVPLNKNTRHMIDAEAFKLMKKTAVIVNTSRGPIIDEKALIAALETGEIAGAGLDVFEAEPVDFANPLLKMNNVISTPHCGWYSEESKIAIREQLTEDIVRALNGEKPNGFVNKADFGG